VGCLSVCLSAFCSIKTLILEFKSLVSDLTSASFNRSLFLGFAILSSNDEDLPNLSDSLLPHDLLLPLGLFLASFFLSLSGFLLQGHRVDSC